MQNDDSNLQSYQDDLNSDDKATDPIMEELGENPAEEIGIPEKELAKELDDLAIDEPDEDGSVKEDATAQVEGADEETDQDYGGSRY